MNKLLFFLFFSLLFLNGCGGFSDGKVEGDYQSGDSSESTIFISGTAVFPAHVSASMSTVMDSSASAGADGVKTSVLKSTSSSFAVQRGKIGVYHGSDLFFTNNLLKNGVEIYTSERGEFAITRAELKDDFFDLQSSAAAPFILRVSFGAYQLSSLFASGNNSILGGNIRIDPVSDGAIGFLKEEIAYKMGRVSTGSDYTTVPWRDDIGVLALEFARQREKIQTDFKLENFRSADYLVSTPVWEKTAGNNWGLQFRELAESDSTWSEAYARKEILGLEAVSYHSPQTLPQLSRLRRKQQLLYAALEFGFFAIDQSGNILCRDNIKYLEKLSGSSERQAPALGDSGSRPSFYVSTQYHLLEGFIPGITSAAAGDDGVFLPPPPDTAIFTTAELLSFGNRGASFKEKMVLIARNALSLPFITPEVLDVLADENLDNLPGFSIVLELCGSHFQQWRHSVERVQRTLGSGGLVVFGENVMPAAVYGGRSMTQASGSRAVSHIDNFWRNWRFEADLNDSYEKFLAQPTFYFNLFRDFYHLRYERMKQAGELITENNNYPNPNTENSARYLLFRKVAGAMVYDSEAIRREADRLRFSLSALSAGSLNLSRGLDFSRTGIRASELLPFISIFSSLSYPLTTNVFYRDFQAAYSGQTPDLENTAVSTFPTVNSTDFWSELLSLPLSTTADLRALQTSMENMSVTSISHLSVVASGATSVVLAGRIILGKNGSTIIPAEKFPVFARSANNIYMSQTDADGYYSFSQSPVKGDSLYDIYVEVRDVTVNSLSPSNPQTLSFSYYIGGHEKYQALPDFSLDAELALISTNFVNRRPYESLSSLIQPLNRAPEVRFFTPIPAVSSGIVPISFILFDEDNRELDVHFSFVSGESQSASTDSPLISTSPLPVTTDFGINGFINGLPSAGTGVVTTLYWHTANERGPDGIMGESSQSSVKVQLSVYADSRQISGNTTLSDFFELDNDPPQLTISSPLPTDPPTVLKSIDVRGLAADRSRITTISVVNLTNSTGIHYYAVPTGENYKNWEISGVSVKSGIVNTLSFTVMDEFGNTNRDEISTTFRSQDSQPPLLYLTSVEVFSLRSSVLKGTYETAVYKSADGSLRETAAVTGALSVSYVFPERSEALSISAITTRSLRFTGTATDQNSINLIRMRNEINNIYTEAAFSQRVSTDNKGVYDWEINYTVPASPTANLSFFFSAVDEFQNDSGTLKDEWKEHRKSGSALSITTVDVLGPDTVLLTPSVFRTPEVITTSVITLGGAAVDSSKIVSFVLCSSNSCEEVSNISGDFSEWLVTMSLSQKQSNQITGFITDEYGFVTYYTQASPFKTYNLNDITPPTISVTSVDGVTIPTTIVVNSSFDNSPRTSPEVFYASQCADGICTLTISGFAADESGIGLVPDGAGENFSGLIMRLNHQAADAFNPDDSTMTKVSLYGDGISLFGNQRNKTIITTHPWPEGVSASGVQTLVPYTANLQVEQDGYWPLWVRVTDASTQQFNPFVQPRIDKREVFYVKRDIKAPLIKEIKVENPAGGEVSNISLMEIYAEDELSDIAEFRIVNGDGAEFLIGPADFIRQPPLSSWYDFIPTNDQPSLSAVKAVTWVTSESGTDRKFTVYAKDIHGNVDSQDKQLDIIPLFQQTIEHEKDFSDPVCLRFGGNNFDSIFLLDGGKNRVEQRTLSPVPTLVDSKENPIYGNQKKEGYFYKVFTTGTGLDFFYRKSADGVEYQSLLIHGNFGDSSASSQIHSESELLYLSKEKLDFLNLNHFVTPDLTLDSSAYHVFRDSRYAGVGSIMPQTSVFRFSPLLDNVVYVFQGNQSGSDNQLFRFVNGFRELSAPLMASQGGNAVSTGFYGITTHQISEVKSIAVTQVHVEGSYFPSDGVDRSEEWIYLAQQNPHRISRLHYINLQVNSGGGFRSLDPINLVPGDTAGLAVSGLTTTIIPVAMSVEDNGRFAYVGSAADQKIYKIAIHSNPPTLVSSFGGYGIGSGFFRSINDIYGYRPRSQEYFQRLYVVDRDSKAISVWTSNGDFVSFYGRNDYTLGGMVAPDLIGSGGVGKGNDSYDTLWYVVDKDLDSLTFYNSGDFHNRRIFASELGLSGFTNPVSVAVSDAYIYATTAIRKIFLFDSGLDANGIFEIELREYDGSITKKGVIPKNVFSNLRDMVLVQDERTADADVVGILTLENINPGSTDRVQWYSEDFRTAKQSVEVTVTSSSTHICDFTTGVVLVGPTNKFLWHKYPSGTRFLGATAKFEDLPLTGFLGETLFLEAPQSVACNSSRIFVADKNRVLVFETPTAYTEAGSSKVQSRLKQEIRIAEPNTGVPFSNNLDLMIRGDSLYVLEKNLKLIRKFRVQ